MSNQCPPQVGKESDNLTETQLYGKLYGKLRTKIYDKLNTELYYKFSTKLSGEFRTEPNDKVPAELYPEVYNELYNKLYTELYPNLYKGFYPMLYNELYTDHYDELNTEFYKKLHTKFYGKFYTEIYKELHTELDKDIRSRLYNQFYNQLYNQMTNSVDQGSSKSSSTSSPSSTLASKDQDNHEHADNHGSHQDSLFSLENGPQNQKEDTSILPVKSRQAFNITKVTLPPQFSFPIITIDTHEYEYALKMKVFDAWAIPTFVLYFLSFHPDIMLPLASLREPLLESCLQLAQDTFYTYPNIDGPVALIPTLLHSIVCGRVSRILYGVKPYSKAWYEISPEDPMSRTVSALEKGPNPALQAIVKDSMVAYNPIKVLISFLRAMVDKYRSFARPMPQDNLVKILLDSGSTLWLYRASKLSCIYGLFMWDSSQWISDAECDALVQYMTIITTEIFPNVYDRISAIEGDGDRSDRTLLELNDFIKHVLDIITPCFLYHYRPMNNPIALSLDHYWAGPYEHNFTAPGYFDGLKAFPGILHSCTIEYLQNPSKFQGLPTAGLPKLSASDVMSKSSRLMTEYCFGVNEFDGCDRTNSLRWRMRYPQYNHDYGAFSYLNDIMLRHPPVKDPVYQRISSIFPKSMKRSNLIDEYTEKKNVNPQFTCPS